jgi:diguanylate cyclase (GGDEF)-like protein
MKKSPSQSEIEGTKRTGFVDPRGGAPRFSSPHDHPHFDPPEITAKIDDYRMHIIQDNAAHGLLPFFLATLSYAALFSNLGSRAGVLGWLGAVLALVCLRLFLIAKYREADNPSDKRWVRYNVMLLAALGCLYGSTPFWFQAGGEIWLLAVSNLWLAGLAISVLLSQGLIVAAGLAFAVPAITPLLCLLLFAGEAPQTLMALGNVLLLTYFYSVIRRIHAAIMDQARHRVLFEQLAHHYDEQHQRSDSLVADLSDQIERRKKAEIALREARDAAETMSNQDPLTNLSNRREFDRVLAQAWRRSLRATKPLSLIVCKIDLFRSYNDQYGSLAGDQCLTRIGREIEANMNGPGDLAARTSGEQFSVLLPDTTEDAALNIAETIRQAVHDLTILHAGSPVERVVTASFGVATAIPSEADAQHELIETADHALTRARRGGGNCVFAIYGAIADSEK